MKKFSLAAPLTILLALLTSSAFAKTGLTDEQAIGYVLSSNQGQVELSQIAEARTSNAEIKEFAAHMIKVHVDRSSEFTAMEKKLSLHASTSTDTKELEAALAKDKEELTKASNPMADKMFLHQEIDHHKKVISEITAQMLPSVTKAEVKTALTAMLPRIQQNLEKAEAILKKLDLAFGK